MTPQDLFSNRFQPKAPQRILVTYDYMDATGELLFQVVRFDPKDFRQRRPDKSCPDGWAWNLNGVDKVLYNLPKVLDQVKRGKAVYVVEGEKDVESLATIDAVATTCPGGAGKWKDGHSDTLKGAHVVLLPDNDHAGRMHMRAVALSLIEKAASVRILELPNLPPKGDATDWLAMNGTKAGLTALVKSTPVCKPQDRSSRVISLLSQLAERIEELATDPFKTDYDAVALSCGLAAYTQDYFDPDDERKEAAGMDA